MSVTIKDIAREAGVSPSTVSRVISKHPRISRDTADRVTRIMEELGYHPNAMAKRLVAGASKTIAAILPQPAEELFQYHFFHEVVRGILANANRAGYDLLLVSGRNPQDELDTLSRFVNSGRVDGVILMNSRIRDPLIAFLAQHRFPTVIIGRSLEHADMPSIDNDNVQAAYDATRHLIDCGHERIGFVCGPPDLTVSRDRMHGYRKALADAALPFRDDWIVEGEFLQESGYRAMSYLMGLVDRPTALVVIDDLVALGVMRGIAVLGFRVPDDICIVSFNNIALTDLSTPRMTSVDIGMYQIGYTTSQSLIRLMAGEPPHQTQIVIPHKLVVRESSTPFGRLL